MKGRLLVIDNDADTLDVLQEALTYEGWEVTALPGTIDIVHTVADHRPDLILMDFMLNGINGGELCSQVKKTVQTAALPVVLMSAYGKVMLSLGDYGCDRFVPKPFDLEELNGVISELVSKYERQRYQ